MGYTLGLFCVLSFFAGTGDSLSCTVCLVQGATLCTGNSVTCLPGRVCAATYTITTEESSLLNQNCLSDSEFKCNSHIEDIIPYNGAGEQEKTDGIKRSEFSGRSCVPENQCQGPGSFSTPNTKSNKGFSCCYTDNCTPPLPEIAPDNNKDNGQTCPTCTASGSRWCDTGETMKCTGDETRCLLQYTNMSGTLSSETVLRGCATPTICNIGNQSLITDGISVDVQVSCSGGCLSYYRNLHFQVVGFMIIILFLTF